MFALLWWYSCYLLLLSLNIVAVMPVGSPKGAICHILSYDEESQTVISTDEIIKL